MTTTDEATDEGRCPATSTDPLTTRRDREDGWRCGREAGHPNQHMLYSADGEEVLYSASWTDVAAARPTDEATDEFIDVVFDGPPAHESGRFVEVENPRGVSVSVGQWIDRGNGLWALRLPAAARPADEDTREALGDVVGEFRTRAEAFRESNPGVRSAYLNAADMVERAVTRRQV